MSFEQRDFWWNIFVSAASLFLLAAPTLLAGLLSGMIAVGRQTARAAFWSAFVLTASGGLLLSIVLGLAVDPGPIDVADGEGYLPGAILFGFLGAALAPLAGLIFGTIWSRSLSGNLRQSLSAGQGRGQRRDIRLLVSITIMAGLILYVGTMHRQRRLKPVGPIPQGMIACPEARNVSDWVADLNSDEAHLRHGAVRALAYLAQRRPSPDAMAALLDALRSPDEPVRRLALEGLRSDLLQLRSRDVPVFLAALRDQNEQVRRAAADVLLDTYLVDRDKKAIAALSAALFDDSVFVRRTAAKMLARYGSEARPAAPVLEAARQDPDPEVRREASVLLKKLREQD